MLLHSFHEVPPQKWLYLVTDQRSRTSFTSSVNSIMKSIMSSMFNGMVDVFSLLYPEQEHLSGKQAGRFLNKDDVGVRIYWLRTRAVLSTFGYGQIDFKYVPVDAR